MLYESHITCHLEHAEVAQQVADELGWKTSEIHRDITLGKAPYFYLTCHSRDCLKIHDKMEGTADALRKVGVNVIREKIELIIYDTKMNHG